MARELYQQAAEAGEPRTQLFALHMLADCPLIRGDYEAARTAYAESASFARKVGSDLMVAEELQGVAMALAGLGESERALRLAGAAFAQWARAGVNLDIPFWVRLLDRHLGQARTELGAEAAARAWDEGWSTPLHKVADEVLGPETAVR